jgi:hypothetical protein
MIVEPHSPKDIINHVLGLKSFDYDQITDTIFLGTNMCCQAGFDKELLSKGVRADISLEELRVDAPQGVDYFVWLPTIDHTAPTMEHLLFGMHTLNFCMQRNIKVYIHCKNGHGRATTLLAAWLIKKQGKTVDEAIALIKEKRPTIHLQDVQIEALKKFAAMA